MNRETVSKIYRRLGFSLNLQGHDKEHFHPSLPKEAHFSPPLPSQQMIDEYTVAQEVPKFSFPDPDVAVAQARKTDRKAMREDKKSVVEI